MWYLIVWIPDLCIPLYLDLASKILLFYVLFVVALIEYFGGVSLLCGLVLTFLSSFCNHLAEEKRGRCFTLIFISLASF